MPANTDMLLIPVHANICSLDRYAHILPCLGQMRVTNALHSPHALRGHLPL
jgi:hypothetical protein